MLIDVCLAKPMSGKADHSYFCGDRDENVALFDPSSQTFTSDRRLNIDSITEINIDGVVIQVSNTKEERS